MEKFQEMMELSKKKLHIADHILTQTYLLIKDAKLLLSVIENTFLSLSYSISALLYYERFFRRIPAFGEDFQSRFSIFLQRCVPAYKFKKEHILLIQKIKEIIIARKKSPIEFMRKDRFVICTDNYSLTTISFEQTSDYLKSAKEFINFVESIILKEETQLTK